MDNYPVGARNDPNAPWNEKDPVTEICFPCRGTGLSSDGMCEFKCEDCDGAGYLILTDEDIQDRIDSHKEDLADERRKYG